MGAKEITTLTDLTDGTQKYFKKLPGYDTLRIVLAKRSILVEGPSDELIVQKAYLHEHGRLPIQDGIDVINVKGLSFRRFLEIAKLLKKQVSVVTDNDGDWESVVKKYSDFTSCKNIRICVSQNNNASTLEPQMVAVNDLKTLNAALSKKSINKDSLLKFMSDKRNKTECALRVFETKTTLKFPKYIEDAIKE